MDEIGEKFKLVLSRKKKPCFSAKPTWNTKSRNYKCSRGSNITCGMLPTLRALASRECNDQGSICMVPLDVEMDAASHLQMILLEAYCREIGIRVSRVPLRTLQNLLGPGHSDLSCVLIDEPYFVDPPEWRRGTIQFLSGYDIENWTLTIRRKTRKCVLTCAWISAGGTTIELRRCFLASIRAFGLVDPSTQKKHMTYIFPANRFVIFLRDFAL